MTFAEDLTAAERDNLAARIMSEICELNLGALRTKGQAYGQGKKGDP